MIVYAIIIFVIVILRLNLDNEFVGLPKYRQETKYLKIVCGILIILAALRGNSVGTDTLSYVQDYSQLSTMTVSQVLEKSGTIGAGYHFASKIFSLTGLSVHWWFGVVASFYIFAIYRFIQKFSSDKLVSILCFFTMGLFTFSMAGLKQTMAMGFAALVCIALDERRYFGAVILGVLAFWCHSATSIFAFGLAVYFFRERRYFYLLLGGFFILVLVAGEWMWQMSIGLLNDEHYSELYSEADNIYSAWTFAYYILLLVLLVVPWRAYNSEKPYEARLMYGMAILATAFQSLATSFSTAFRVAYFFLPFMLILIPNSCLYMKNKKLTRSWKVIFCMICIFWMLYTERNSVFSFFWNN